MVSCFGQYVSGNKHLESCLDNPGIALHDVLAQQSLADDNHTDTKYHEQHLQALMRGLDIGGEGLRMLE